MVIFMPLSTLCLILKLLLQSVDCSVDLMKYGQDTLDNSERGMLLTVLTNFLYVTVAWVYPLFLFPLWHDIYIHGFLLVGAEASVGQWPQPG